MPNKSDLSRAETVERPYGTLFHLVPDTGSFNQLTASIISVEAGHRTSRHSHPQDELWHIMAGRGVVAGSNQTFEVGVGDTVLIAPDDIHQIENASHDSPLIYLAVMSPRRVPDTITYYA